MSQIVFDVDIKELKRLLTTIVETAVDYDDQYLGAYVCEYCGAEANHPRDVVHDKGGRGGAWPRCIVYTAQELLEQLEYKLKYESYLYNE